MSRTTKVLGFSVPPALFKEVEGLAKAEHRTKSELFREMVRVYSRYRQQRQQDEDRWILNIIAEAKAEQAKNPKSTEEMLKESERLALYGEQQAKRLGIKPKDVNRIINEYRQSQQS
ncbi:MAG: ribbon-helix-helix protein, CopG family [Acidobacteria bacterium]|nr:ribbon-helix-helix protein, CopG family [Acidobacteriota bacterium]